MANVKMNNKSLLEKLQAEIILKLGKKISQQEILDRSVDFVYKKLDSFIQEELNHPELTKEIIEKIKKNAINVQLSHLEKSDDEFIKNQFVTLIIMTIILDTNFIFALKAQNDKNYIRANEILEINRV